jgi:hypothetical protein
LQSTWRVGHLEFPEAADAAVQLPAQRQNIDLLSRSPSLLELGLDANTLPAITVKTMSKQRPRWDLLLILEL